MANDQYVNGVLRQSDDDVNFQHHYYDATGVELPAGQSPIAYTAAEVTAAQARNTQSTRANNLTTIFTQAQNALANNSNYTAIVSPTNAQVVAQVQALTNQNNKIIRVLLALLKGDLSQLDSTS